MQSQIKGVNWAVFGGVWSPWNHSICASYQWPLWESTCHTIATGLLAYIRRYFHLKSTCHTIATVLLAYMRRYFHLKSTCHTIATVLLAYIRRYLHLKSTCHTFATVLLAYIRRYFHLKSTCHTIDTVLLAYIRRDFHLKSTCQTIDTVLLAYIRRYFHLKSTPYKNICFKAIYAISLFLPEIVLTPWCLFQQCRVPLLQSIYISSDTNTTILLCGGT